MSDENNDPKVNAYRLTTLEKKVDGVAAEIKALQELLQKNLCPCPGSCVTVMDGLRDLREVVSKHEEALQLLKIETERAKASFRTVALMVGGTGSLVGFIGSVLIQLFSK